MINTQPSHTTAERGSRIRAAVYGLAFGDAWGFVTEFTSYASIMRVQPAPPRPLVVSDDTQMSLYTLEAISQLRGEDLSDLPSDRELQARVRDAFATQYLRFYDDPDNDRATGNTCMIALGSLDGNATATPVARNDSKGCGTIMRAPWLGLLPYPVPVLASLSVLQSQVTHGHPLSWVSAAACTLLVRELAALPQPVEGLELVDLADECAKQAGSIPLLAEHQSHVDFQRAGIQMIRDQWELFISDEGDPCQFFGDGWVAEETFTTALATFARNPHDPMTVIRDLVYTHGDSDSLAAVGGAFAGALNGDGFVTEQMVADFEPRYQQELAETVASLTLAYGEI